MVDIVLVNPPGGGLRIPLGVAYIAALLERNGLQVECLDAKVEKLSVEDTVKRVIAKKPTFVGIMALTTDIPNAYQE